MYNAAAIKSNNLSMTYRSSELKKVNKNIKNKKINDKYTTT